MMTLVSKTAPIKSGCRSLYIYYGRLRLGGRARSAFRNASAAASNSVQASASVICSASRAASILACRTSISALARKESALVFSTTIVCPDCRSTTDWPLVSFNALRNFWGMAISPSFEMVTETVREVMITSLVFELYVTLNDKKSASSRSTAPPARPSAARRRRCSRPPAGPPGR